MSEELTLQLLIDKLRTDLFMPYAGISKQGKSIYPIFLVDEVELELAVNIKYDTELGVQISIPQVADVSLGAGKETGELHKMKIKLCPILSRDEMRQIMDEDERLMQGVREASLLALRKGSELAGSK